ncbi:MAG: ferrochelatase [Proteobacteria bacterium]|nr:ferrochelatase [Pseudomonadota bacterium]
MAGKKHGIALLAFGAIDSLDDMEPYLKNILGGKPLPPGILEATKKKYELIGGSPLFKITEAQAGAIESKLREMGDDSKVYVGMRFWKPYIKDVVAEMIADGVEVASVVIMSPFNTPAATGWYEEDWRVALKEQGSTMKTEFIKNWHINPWFTDIIMKRIKENLAEYEEPKKDALVIFANHSLSLEALEGDVYEFQIDQAITAITSRIEIDFRKGYQSKGRSLLGWIGPKVEEVIDEAHELEKKCVVVVPLGFAADHVETLYDIDILFKKKAEELGLVYKRTESLNTDPQFIEMLAKLLKISNERLAS